MVRFPNYKSKLLRLNARLPIYDMDDNVIGFTQENDTVVVTLDDGNYFETVVTSGTFTGTDRLALSKNDILKCTVILNKCEDFGMVYVKDKKVKYEYV